jgi:UDP-glucose 4-epimerase
MGREDFCFIEDTILNAALVDELTGQVDQVYHLAAVVGVKNVVDDPGGCIRVNVVGTEVVLEAAHRRGKRTVVVSSSEVYGKSADLPLAEDGDCLLGPTNIPRWSYALAKAIDEQLALDYARRGLPVCALRYFNSYGPRLDTRGYGSVVARFIGQALRDEPLTVYGDGRQSRTFTYVDDTVRATILAGELDAAVGGVFNIGGNRETSVLELAGIIRELTGSQSEIVRVPYGSVFGKEFEETRRRVPDTRRAAEALGFRAQISLEEGLRRTVDWFRERSPDEPLDGTRRPGEITSSP